eukprot:5974321-Lingulodinium_polyedra.AAC.1
MLDKYTIPAGACSVQLRDVFGKWEPRAAASSVALVDPYLVSARAVVLPHRHLTDEEFLDV